MLSLQTVFQEEKEKSKNLSDETDILQIKITALEKALLARPQIAKPDVTKQSELEQRLQDMKLQYELQLAEKENQISKLQSPEIQTNSESIKSLQKQLKEQFLKTEHYIKMLRSKEDQTKQMSEKLKDIEHQMDNASNRML